MESRTDATSHIDGDGVGGGGSDGVGAVRRWRYEEVKP